MSLARTGVFAKHRTSKPSPIEYVRTPQMARVNRAIVQTRLGVWWWRSLAIVTAQSWREEPAHLATQCLRLRVRARLALVLGGFGVVWR